MVSILSFFTKKRPKTSATSSPDASDNRRPTSPTSHLKAASGTVSRGNRSKVSLKELKDRRASLDSYGLSKRKNSSITGLPAVGGPPRITIDLPFELDNVPPISNNNKRAVRASMPISHSMSLGLDSVGRTPIISAAERRVLDSQRYTPDDLRAAWDWLGREVMDRGAETVGIMLPRRFENDKDRQRQLSVLFVLARRPELTDKFPTVASTYPSTSKDEASALWKARLIQVTKDTENPVDIAETLKAMLRRLAGNSRPIIDPSVYVRFVQQEHAASYPRNAYATMLLPHLSKEVAGLLDAVLEVCNAIAMHAENNAMSGGRLSHLVGWWLLGKLPDGTSGWNALYSEYKLAGQRAEHLFYARIRWQSTQQKMPRRLVQLILSYPFGESSASSEHLPLPPASTFARRVLHVALGTDAAVPSGTDPMKVLGDAIIAKLDPKAEIKAAEWEILRTKDGRPITIEDLLSTDSLAFLDDVSSAKGIAFTSPQLGTTALPEEDSRYHPFADDGDRIITSNFSDARRRSSSYGDVPRLEFSSSSGTPSLLDAGTDGGSPRKSFSSGLARYSSTTHLSATNKRLPAWDDFASRGFSDSPDTAEISLALTKPVTPRKDLKSWIQPTKKVIVKEATPSTNLLVVGEEVINVDDGFIHFVEDGQLDPVASTAWPRFALVQLNTPVKVGDDNISWLLVTVKKRQAARVSEDDFVPDLHAELARSMSPSNESSISRLSSFGLRDLANTFRRSSIYAGRSSSRSGYNAKTKGDVLPPVKERAPTRISVASDVPTEYTIGETGEIVKIPTALELATIAAGGTPRSSTPVSSMAVETARSITATQPSDWVYLAEGGAHVVFRYGGSEPKFQGRALRLQKVAKKGAPDVAVRHAWSDKLLPMVLPANLLPETTPVTLEERWTRALVTPTEILRQSNRRAEGSLAQIVDYSRPVQLMDNLTAPIKGEKVLALEIKPKWGFVPSATNLTPHESIAIKTRNCRFCIHQHYRGELDEDGYCPLDLYSGEQPRVRRALYCLWKAWHASAGEKNNLRVFVDGRKILPKDEHLIPTSGENIPSGMYSLVEPLLTSSNVLATLKKLQTTLDPQDISSLAQDFAVAHPGEKLFDPALVPEPTISELAEFVMLYKKGEVNWTLRQREIAYSLSAIFKDCSIIVRAVLKPLDSGYALDDTKSVVKIIDTDLKPLASLGHWAELDDKLWRHWSKTKTEEKKSSPLMVDSVAANASKTEEKKCSPRSPLKVDPVAANASVTPASHSTPVTPVNSTARAAALASASAATLSVNTPRSSPPKAVSSPVPSIPDMEDANSALARVVDPLPVPSEFEILSDIEQEKEGAETPVATEAAGTREAVEAAEPEVAQPGPAATKAEAATASVEADATPVESDAVPVESVTVAPAEEYSIVPPAAIAATAAVAAAVGAAAITSTDEPEAPVEPEHKDVEVDVKETPAEETPEVKTAAEEVTSPDDVFTTAVQNTPFTEDKAPEMEPVVTKPTVIDLAAAKAFDETPALSPISVVDPSSPDVPPEDRVDFDADPFAKAPVVLASKDSRTNLASVLNAPLSPVASIAASGVATPVAAFPSAPSTPATGTPTTSNAALGASPLEKTVSASRVRDKIKAFESKDVDHKPMIPSSRRVSALGLGGIGKSAEKAKTPEKSKLLDKDTASKKPTKKTSFVNFVRKASATFERPPAEKRRVSASSESADKSPSPVTDAPPSTLEKEKDKKERGVNPFGSLRSKKKAAATAGAAAIAATATVASVGIEKKEPVSVPEGSPESAFVEGAVITHGVTAPVNTPASAIPAEATPDMTMESSSEASTPADDVVATPASELLAPVPAAVPAVTDIPEVPEPAEVPAEVETREAEAPAEALEAPAAEKPVADAESPVEAAAEPPAANTVAAQAGASTTGLAFAEITGQTPSLDSAEPVVPAAESVESTAAPVEPAAEPVEPAKVEVTGAAPDPVAPVETSAESVEATQDGLVSDAAPKAVAEPTAEKSAPVETSEAEVSAAPEAESTTTAAHRSPRSIPSNIHIAKKEPISALPTAESVPPTSSTASFMSAMQTPNAQYAMSPRTDGVSPDPAMPESAVLPKKSLPIVAGIGGAAVGLGLGDLNRSVDESEELASETASGLNLAFEDAEESEELAPPAVDLDPPTPVAASSPEYFTTNPVLKTGGFSAVTPEFASTGVFASPPAVASPLHNVPEDEEAEADTTFGDGSPETLAPAATESTPVRPRAIPANVDVEGPVKMVSRSASPIPGPPENVEMYQHASLPPLPSQASSGTISATPVAAAVAAEHSRDTPSRCSTDIDSRNFATAPDTPISETDHFEDDQPTTLDLPELTAFTKRMSDRRISTNESFVDSSDDRASSKHTAGHTIADSYRTSVHTFGGTQSEAAWLNGIKGRLSLDDARPKLGENDELGLSPAASALKTLTSPKIPEAVEPTTPDEKQEAI